MRHGTLIVVSGIDGSGKSTQATLLCERLRKEGWRADYVWARRVPVLTRLPAWLIKQLFLRERKKSDGDAYLSITPRRKAIFKSRFYRFCWTRSLLCEYLLVTWFRIRLSHRGAHYIVVDRYLPDALVDFASMAPDPVGELKRMRRSWMVRMFPTASILFLIDIPAEIGWQRKKDGTSLDYLADRQPLYVEFTRGCSSSFVLDGTRAVDEVGESIWRLFDMNRG